MKDMYTFDSDEDGALRTYAAVCESYRQILAACDLNFIQVAADSGDIGGDYSHEFHVRSSVGEDVLLTCGVCGSVANQEKAVGVLLHASGKRTLQQVRALSFTSSCTACQRLPNTRSYNLTHRTHICLAISRGYGCCSLWIRHPAGPCVALPSDAPTKPRAHAAARTSE